LGAAHSVLRTITPLATLTSGVATGAGAFATSYAILPRLGIYKRLSEYDGETLWQDLSAHLTFGTVLGVTRRALTFSSQGAKSRGKTHLNGRGTPGGRASEVGLDDGQLDR
jgi:hypothetical protein